MLRKLVLVTQGIQCRRASRPLAVAAKAAPSQVRVDEAEQAVFLGAQSPEHKREFLYVAEGGFQGEAADLLAALNIESAGRSADAVLVEFQKKGYLAIEKDKATEDAVMEAAIEAGAEDVKTTDQYHEVMTEPEAFGSVKSQLEEKKIPIAVSEVSMIPTTEVELDSRKADQMMRLMEALEDHDDVQHVWANANFAVEEAG